MWNSIKPLCLVLGVGRLREAALGPVRLQGVEDRDVGAGVDEGACTCLAGTSSSRLVVDDEGDGGRCVEERWLSLLV